jgi:hypothetical protein
MQYYSVTREEMVMKDEMRHKGVMTAVLSVCPWCHDSNAFCLSMVSQMQYYLFLCLWYYDSSAFGLPTVYSVILSVAQTVKNQTLRQCVNNEMGIMQKKVVMV